MPFIRGVARIVASEAHKKAKRISSVEDIPERDWDRSEPNQASAGEQESGEYLRCLERCMKTLPAEDERLIREYYLFEKRQKIDRKRGLAEELGISAGALRVKAFKIRKKLQDCVLACVTK